MKVRRKDKITYLGFFLFALSMVATPLNESAAVILLVSSFGTLILTGLLKS